MSNVTCSNKVALLDHFRYPSSSHNVARTVGKHCSVQYGWRPWCRLLV